ncbi:dapper homolog 1 [Salarias fasciatus]|uniref:Dishevelled binding antagonist of beta catenin 1 n=1 Tax=Salarias fasciatus TaxID=181472 RepID=A0A672I3S1_SALFA|nr:dapper homolog 1 [Salarias fasciatus]
MLLSGGRCGRDGDAAERPRPVRERLEAAVSGLGELEFLRQRQEELVRAALELQEAAEDRRREVQLSSEEKLLEENILLLRRQLNCLRRRDVGLLSQLQELDRQISDLRLDTEASHDLPETDSRPSSGFFELSDAASGSLSNSSNSVFSECFCMTIDADGRLTTTDEAPGCSECDRLFGGLWDDSSSSATVRRSVSAPHPPASDVSSSLVSTDVQSVFHCDLLSRSGGEVYRYPSPLHAVAVQSPADFLGHGGHGRQETGNEGLKPETSSFVPPSSSWPASSSPSSSSQTPPHKRLDGYIYSLLQRRAQPVRTCRPRTSISTDPSKSVLRQVGLCSRQLSSSGSGPGPSPGTLRASELQPFIAASSSPQRQVSVERKAEEQETTNVLLSCSETMPSSFQLSGSPRALGAKTSSTATNQDVQMNSLRKQSKVVLPLGPAIAATPLKDFQELSSVTVGYSPKESKRPRRPPDQELLLKPPPQSGPPKTRPRPLHSTLTDSPYVPEQQPVAASSLTQHEDRRSRGVKNVSIHCKVRKSGSRKSGRLRSAVTLKTVQESEHIEAPLVRRGDKSHRRAKGSRLLDDGGSTRTTTSKRGVSSRTKRIATPQAESQVDRPSVSTPRSVRSAVSKHHHHGNHHRRHQHGREPVVVITKLKHKRDDYQRLRTTAEVPYDEALRRAQRRRRKELPTDAYAASSPGGRVCSPYAYTAGSDSEYSAECASLFHSTIMDTSEDETSNYTTNRFGDSESGEDALSTSDTEESGGGGAGGPGRARGRGGAAGQDVTMTPAQAKACVKIKASHNLKKKILRFRSGSLKLMTTV